MGNEEQLSDFPRILTLGGLQTFLFVIRKYLFLLMVLHVIPCQGTPK